MIGLMIVPARSTYFSIELDGVPVTNETFTKNQAEDRYAIYQKIYQSGWDSAVDWVNEDL